MPAWHEVLYLRIAEHNEIKDEYDQCCQNFKEDFTYRKK